MASKKSKILAIAFCAAVMSGIYAPNVVLADDFYYKEGTTNVGDTTLKNPEIHHETWYGDRHPIVGDENCKEPIADTNVTVGDINKVVSDLVDNDVANTEKINKVEDTVNKINDAYENGELKGDKGDQGEKGEKGDKGDQGIQGEKGEKGDKGDQGIQGEKGEKGDKGDQGIQGEKGEKGDKGDQGIQGEKGDKGDKGDQGIQGEKGEKGDKGDTGAKGDSIVSGSYDVKDGKVEMPIKNDKGDIVGNVTINDVASKSEMEIADAVLDNKIKNEQLEREYADDQIKADLAQETNNRIEADAQLQQSIDIQREVIGAGSTDELKGAYSGTNYIKDANNMAEADVILDREISNVNSRVDGIENRVDGLEDRIDKVGAMAAAIANLRTMGYDPAAPTEVAVGVGQYRDETGMALGLFHYPNRDFMLSLSVSTSGDEYMGGIGATWKFGRKSPEKVAEIKKAQAEADARRAEEQKLAKAEEMKKAAKEAKVQAQMERHAKMLAEQEAQAEA